MSVTLVEGQDLQMDSQGGQLFVRFKLGDQRYKSKVLDEQKKKEAIYILQFLLICPVIAFMSLLFKPNNLV